MKSRLGISVMVSLSVMLLAVVFTQVRVTQAARPPAAVPQSLPAFTQIAAGGEHTCALTTGGGVKCWGDSWYGQLNGSGYGSTWFMGTPMDVSGLESGVTALVAGGSHTCALTTGGGVKCWGNNGAGQLGDGTTYFGYGPVDVSGLTSGAMALAVGGSHTCALMDADHGGGVKCWGSNSSGQIGDGTTTNSSVPVDVSGLGSGVTALVAGGSHTCALTASAIKCWGYNSFGQLGDGTTTNSGVPVDVSGLGSGVTALVAGGSHTCALTAGGGTKCWGANGSGQIGDGTTTNSNVPVDVNGLGSGVTVLAAGGSHSCALIAGDGLKCWGRNTYGQLGDGTTTRSSTPVDVSGLGSGVTALAVGGSHTCALTTGGGMKCWGWNEYGQLGDGTLSWRSMPMDINGLESDAVAAGLYHTCALTASGGVKCWGINDSAQLGDGTYTNRFAPMDVSGLDTGVTALVAGGHHACVLMDAAHGGGAKCWGYGWANTPVDVSGLGSGVIALAAGGGQTCALMDATHGGGVKCWGDSQSVPTDVSGLGSGVTALAAGGAHICALTAGGGVKCWGGNYYGQLGDGTTFTRDTPVDVNGLGSGVMALAAGGDHTCALTNGGGVKCWGHNFSGQLGDGTTTNRYTPVDVSGLASGVTALAAGGDHTCALTAGGGMKCWGYNSDGQLGDGTYRRRSMPVDVSGLGSGVTALAAGKSHTCASVGTSRTKCWGSDYYGQLGLGRVIRRLTPVDVVASAPTQIVLNYPTGQPGSYFTVTGENFPVSSTLTVTVNSAVLTTTLGVNATGGFIFFINTTGADAGDYVLVASANSGLTSNIALAAVSNISATFKLEPTAPLRVQEGGGQTLVVPAGIAVPAHQLFLPLVMR